MRTSCARRAASTLNGCAAGVSNSAIMSFSPLPIVERLCVSLGIRAVSFRYRVRNGIAVLHEGAAEHRVHPQLVAIVCAPGLKGVFHESALFEDRLCFEQAVRMLVDTGVEIRSIDLEGWSLLEGVALFVSHPLGEHIVHRRERTCRGGRLRELFEERKLAREI